MSKCYTLWEIQEAFDSLRASIRNGQPGKGANVRFFNDANLTLRQAIVLAWLMDHQDSIYTTQQMCKELHIPEDMISSIIDALLDRQFLEMKGRDIDVSEAITFIILDFQAMRECGMISSWSEYYAKQKGDIEEDDQEEEESEFTIEKPDFIKALEELEDEEALERMEAFDPLEADNDSMEDEDD